MARTPLWRELVERWNSSRHERERAFDANDALRAELDAARQQRDDAMKEVADTVGFWAELRDARLERNARAEEAEQLQVQRESLKVELEACGKALSQAQSKIDAAEREQAERAVAIGSGKLMERMAKVIDGTPFIATVDLAAAILSDLAQMPVELPSAFDIESAWYSHDGPSGTTCAATKHGVLNMIQSRLAPLLAARKIVSVKETAQTVATKAPSLLDRFYAESLRNENGRDDWYATLGDIRVLIALLDR